MFDQSLTSSVHGCFFLLLCILRENTKLLSIIQFVSFTYEALLA